MFQFLFLPVGFLLMLIIAFGVFVSIPTNNCRTFSARSVSTFTKPLRRGPVAHLFYWMLPIAILFLVSFWGGVFWLAACIMGHYANDRYLHSDQIDLANPTAHPRSGGDGL